MGDEVEPSVQGLSDGYILAQVIAAAGAEYIQPAGSTLLADHSSNISGASLPLDGFGANWAADSLQVTIQTGEAFIGGAFVATDDQHNVTLAASTADQTVYVGWDFDATNTVKIGLDAAFNESDPKIAAWTFETDGSGVIDAVDERPLGPEGGGTVLSDGALIGRFLATGRAEDAHSTPGAEPGEIFRAPGDVADFILWVENGQGRVDLTYNAYLDAGTWRAQTGTQRAFRISFSTQFGFEIAEKHGDDIISAGDPIDWRPWRIREGTIIDAQDTGNPVTLYGAAEVPQERLGGPAGLLSDYPLRTVDLDGSEGESGQALRTDGTTGGVSWGASVGVVDGWTPLESWNDGDGQSTFNNSITVGSAYDLVRVEAKLVNTSASDTWFRVTVNNIGTSSYSLVGIDTDPGAFERQTGQTSWHDICELEAGQMGHTVFTVRGADRPSNINRPASISFETGGSDPDAFIPMCGRGPSIGELDTLEISTPGNAMTRGIAYGLTF